MSGLSPTDYPEYSSNISNKNKPPLGYGARPALVILDLQKAYFTPGSPLDVSSYDVAASAPSNIQSLVSAARKGKCPIIWTQTVFQSSTLKDAGLWAKKVKHLDVFVKNDSRGLAGFLDGMDPEGDDLVITKKFSSAFFGTSLATQLQMLNVDTLIICGVGTSGCVRQTTLDAMQSGFRPIIVGAACGDRTRELHFANLYDLNAKYGDVVSVEDAASKLQAGW